MSGLVTITRNDDNYLINPNLCFLNKYTDKLGNVTYSASVLGYGNMVINEEEYQALKEGNAQIVE